MNYTVGFTDDAKADLRGIGPGPRADVNRVVKRLRFGPDRRVDLQLEGQEDRYRAYAGRRWRVIFAVLPGRRIQIQRVSRRRGAYEGIEHPGYRDVRDLALAYVAEEESVSAAAAD